MENKETNREQLLKQLFAQHPKVDKFFMTSDDQAFVEAHYANSHAQRFADKEVAEYDRATFELSAEVKKTKDSDKDKGAAAPAAPAAPAQPAPALAASAAPAEPAPEADEKAKLTARYTELYGAKPNHLTGVAKLKTLIEAKEAEGK